jgi:glycosyltransferase involved in cell wall biosynthesis
MSVSAVIPAYNAGQHIRSAIDSVLAQTVPVDEILVVDDGSSDDTCAIVRTYGSRVRIIPQANQGPSAARNTGAREASSHFIAYLDADDRWLPEKIGMQLAAMQANPGAILCYTSIHIDEPGGSHRIRNAVAPGELLPLLRLGNPGLLPSCILLVRSAMLEAGGFPPHLTIGEDQALWLRMFAMGPFCAVPEPLIRYHASNSGVSGNAELMLANGRAIVDQYALEGLTGLSRRLWRRRILSHMTYRAALTARASSSPRQELRYAVQSILTWPSPFWEPYRFKVLAVTLRNAIASR